MLHFANGYTACFPMYKETAVGCRGRGVERSIVLSASKIVCTLHSLLWDRTVEFEASVVDRIIIGDTLASWLGSAMVRSTYLTVFR